MKFKLGVLLLASSAMIAPAAAQQGQPNPNQAAANAFYTADWVAMVTKRWAAPPLRQDWETPMVVESGERRLVAAE